jgi:Ca2+/Na+ antiporter
LSHVKSPVLVGLVLAVGAVMVVLHVEGIAFSVVSLLLGFLVVILVSEPMVEGLREFSVETGLSPHVTGIVSSLASNLPEGVMTLFMVLSPQLREVAILTVMLASAFNGLLLGVLVIMLTYRGGAISLPKEAMEHDIEIMRIAIALCGIVFGAGVILNLFSTNQGATLPVEVPVFLLLAYISYLYFISRRPDVAERKGAEDGYPKAREEHGSKARKRGWVTPILLGLIGILIAAELISGSSEYLVHRFDLHVVIAATLIGLAGTVPEHGIALIGARKGHVEMGVSNLLSGITQSIMLIFPLLALIVPVHLDGYVIYQFLAIAATLWIVKKSIIDDHRLTLDEGFSIILIHTLGILLFDELSLLL